jgi:N-acylneuraminate cytidylyltransferase
MSNICIIPARGGSKRIPRKNIKDFLGKPIIAYSIEAALKSGLFDAVMVSTDDKEIANIAKEYGADVPFLRSKENSSDSSSTVDVLKEVLFRYSKNNQNFDNICCLYPCAPLVTPEMLSKGLSLLFKKKFDAVFPILPYSYPIERSLKLNQNKVTLKYPEFENYRTQELKESYHDAGQFYFIDIEKFYLNSTVFTKNTGAVILTELEAQDIDNPVDWKLAELKYRLKNES